MSIIAHFRGSGALRAGRMWRIVIGVLLVDLADVVAVEIEGRYL